MISHNPPIPFAAHDPPHPPFPTPAWPHTHARAPATRSGHYLRPIHRVFCGPVTGIARNHTPLLAFGQDRDQFPRSVHLPPFFVSVHSTSRFKAPIRPLQRTYTLRIAPDPSKPPDHPPPAAPSPPDFSRARTASKAIPKPPPVVKKHPLASMFQPLHETADVEPHDQQVSAARREDGLPRGTTLSFASFLYILTEDCYTKVFM